MIKKLLRKLHQKLNRELAKKATLESNPSSERSAFGEFLPLEDVQLPDLERWYCVFVEDIGFLVEEFNGEVWYTSHPPDNILCVYGVPVGWDV